MNLGFYSYLSATIVYGVFTLLLLFSWRESLQGKLLFIVMLVSTCWALIAVKISLHDEFYILYYQLFEVIRYIAWYVFLLKLFDVALSGVDQKKDSYQKFIRWALPVTVGFAIILILNEILAGVFFLPDRFVLGIAGNVILALISLAILEQLFRNMSPHYLWATKYLFFGAGGMFAFDFYMYADALLFRSIDQNLWEARGLVHLVGVPLLTIASARIKNWSLNIFVSRDIVLNTTAILAGGFYLLAMSTAGYYLREYGGSWGRVGQVMLIILAVVFLFAVMSSSQLRAWIRVFLGKHFYKNKYDYRIEWLMLTESLNDSTQGKDNYQTVIQAMAHIVDARAGQLWLKDDEGDFNNVAAWQSDRLSEVMPSDSSLIKYLDNKGFVINLLEIDNRADEYEGLNLPIWLTQVDHPWLIVPLGGAGKAFGFVVLANPLVVRPINWEDRDLLKAAAKQVASHLIVLMTSAQLAEAKQFEVFSRLSAFMVHDLKNIAAELELVSRNAKKHSDNPAFVEDAFETVENASADISRLLEQLRNKRAQDEKKVRVDLVALIEEVVASMQNQLPLPDFRSFTQESLVTLRKGQLRNVLAHLVDNAQRATDDDGEILLTLSSSENMHVIEIRDNGHGMNKDFIRERLFKPFDTTRGNAGMGIGMFESREFIRRLGGDIKVQSEPGKGTIITLNIPI
jgi:putative PEP-CTERM system histidine kinase